jgi:hypothetical protein
MKSLKIKAIILVATIGMITYSAMAQNPNNNVPQAVLTAFSAKYPDVQLKKWKTNHSTSIALFVMNNKKYQASYSNNGEWLNTVRNIKHTSSLPVQAMLYLKKGNYASWHIDNMERLRTPSQNIYQVEVDNASGNKMLYEDAGSFEDKLLSFNDNGQLIKAIDNY